jgi:hypothetical protein
MALGLGCSTFQSFDCRLSHICRETVIRILALSAERRLACTSVLYPQDSWQSPKETQIPTCPSSGRCVFCYHYAEGARKPCGGASARSFPIYRCCCILVRPVLAYHKVFVASESYYYYYYYYYYIVSCHRPLLPGTSPFEPAAIPTAQVSSFRLHLFSNYV